MFTALGQSPTEDELNALIASVDDGDKDGQIQLREFLVLRRRWVRLCAVHGLRKELLLALGFLAIHFGGGNAPRGNASGQSCAKRAYQVANIGYQPDCGPPRYAHVTDPSKRAQAFTTSS